MKRWRSDQSTRTHTREMEREKGRKKSDREIRDGEGGG
jgi:hypothetical protein